MGLGLGLGLGFGFGLGLGSEPSASSTSRPPRWRATVAWGCEAGVVVVVSLYSFVVECRCRM